MKRSQPEVDNNEFGFDIGNRFDSFVAWRNSELATQQKLGLWTERWHRVGSGDHHHPAAAARHLEKTKRELTLAVITGRSSAIKRTNARTTRG